MMNYIFGSIGYNQENAVKLIGKKLSHRGSLSKIEKIKDSVTFGFGANRLDDKCFYSDADFSIVCSANLYNKSKLLSLLANHNINIDSESNAQILLSMFVIGGIDGLKEINGDFAFAIWDNNKEQLILGRDYCGCHPLFYAPFSKAKGITFASEYKAFLKLSELTVTPDYDMLQCLQYKKKLPVGRTLFREVKSVLPGAIQIFDLSGGLVLSEKMPKIKPSVSLYSEDQASAALREALSNAIKIRVLNHKCIGIALSGGIDSIGIAFICRKLFPDAKIYTFTAIADSSDCEGKIASSVAKHIKSIHQEVHTPPSLLNDSLEKLVWHLEDPYARSESLQLLKIGEAAKPFVSSLLCGMEADALFAGMARHKILRLMSKYSFLRYFLQEIYDLTQSGLMPSTLTGCLLYYFYFKSKLAPVPKIMNSNYSPERTKFPNDNKELVNIFLSQGFQDAACQDGIKLERSFAASGVSYQSPFLDPELIKIAYSITEDLKFKNQKNKYIFRKALQTWVPKEFLSIPKRPQRMNYDTEFAKALDQAANYYLSDSELSKSGLFTFSDVLQLKNQKKNGSYKAEQGMRLWTAILTQIWYKKFVQLQEDIR